MYSFNPLSRQVGDFENHQQGVLSFPVSRRNNLSERHYRKLIELPKCDGKHIVFTVIAIGGIRRLK